MVQVYEAARDGNPWLSAHAVFTYDVESGEYGLYWFDSRGFAPPERAAGHWNGTALQFIRRSPRGISRQSYVPRGAGQLRSRAGELLRPGRDLDAGDEWELSPFHRELR